MVPAWFRVASKHQETADTWSLALEPVGDELAPFFPGQFAMLYAFGAGEVPIGVSGDLTRPGPLVCTVHAVGAVSRAICGLPEGDQLGVRGPFGTSWPIEQAHGRDIVVVGGGIGLAPLRPIIYHVLAHRERYGKLLILCSGRSPAELLYVEELEDWRGRVDMDVKVTVDTAGPDWHGLVGIVTTLIARAGFDPARATAFVCGPEIMMRFVAAALRERGVNDESIYVSLERSMKCAVGYCGHCQLRELFICKDGPVFRHDLIDPLMRARSL
jgi:NAD(P)H-flavin reductase